MTRKKYSIGCLLLLHAVAAVTFYGYVSLRAFFNQPFLEFGGTFQFANESGTSSKKLLDGSRLAGRWPTDVSPHAVSAMDFRAEWTRDSHSCWYRIELPKEDADVWLDSMHRRLTDRIRAPNPGMTMEGVTRTPTGTIPFHWQNGPTPSWWAMRSGTYAATQMMDWYNDNDSGIGSAVYTHYDVANGVLWAYEYSGQHDILWTRGKSPTDGSPLTANAKTVSNGAEQTDEREP